MKTSFWRLSSAVAACVCLAGAPALARPDRTAPKAGAGTGTATRAPGTARSVGPASLAAGTFGLRPAAILGAAWTADNTPIKQANLRLRNVVTGKVQASAIANEAGQFAFENVTGGSYVVELVSSSGHVIAVGHVFTIAPGETVATFVRTGTKVPWFSGFFNNGASLAALTAASQGITAIAPVARAVSPNR